MKLSRSLFLSFIMLASTVIVPGACGTDGLVGGSCRNGLSYCQGRCIDLLSDERNCGQCSNRCESDVSCINGFCGGGGEGWGGWGGEGVGGSGAHGQFGGGGGLDIDAGGNGAGGFNEFDVIYPIGGSGGGSSVCSPPYNTAEQCGSCNTVCAEPTPVCADIGNKVYRCQLDCEEPLVNCNNACVDLNSDSNNCGTCGRTCPSAICSGGKCIGAQAGHLVSICMNYREVARTSQSTTLLGNAVFFPMTNPVKILSFTKYTDSNVQARLNAVIDWAARARGRTYQVDTITEPNDVNTRLKKPDFDVFIISDQSLAPAGVLGGYGTQWNRTIESFSYVGGMVVVLDGNTGTQEMGELLTNASVLDVTSHSSVSRQQVYNRAPGDIIGASVVSPFLAPSDSCVFTTSATNDLTTSFVVTDNPTNIAERRPLAVHRTAIPEFE